MPGYMNAPPTGMPLAAKTTQCQHELEDLEGALKRMDGAIVTMESRLTSIVRSPGPSAVEKEQPMPEVVPLARALKGYGVVVNQMCSRLEGLIDRIEL